MREGWKEKLFLVTHSFRALRLFTGLICPFFLGTRKRTVSEVADCLLLSLHLSPLERRLPLVIELAALQARKALLPSFPELVLQQRESETL